MTKGIWAGLVAIAFVASSLMTITADAAKDDVPNGQPFQQLQQQVDDLSVRVDDIEPDAGVDSFFDVFFDVFTVDSFFDLFKDNDGNFMVDSFFDVFTEISVHDADVARLQGGIDDNSAKIDTEIVALDLRSNDALNSHNADPAAHPDSFFDVFTEIDVEEQAREDADAELQRQLDEEIARAEAAEAALAQDLADEATTRSADDTSLDERLAEVEDMSNDHWNRIAALEVLVADLEARIAALESGTPPPSGEATECDPNGDGVIDPTELSSASGFPFNEADNLISSIESLLGTEGNGVIDTPAELIFLNTLLNQSGISLACTISSVDIPPCDGGGDGIDAQELLDFFTSLGLGPGNTPDLTLVEGLISLAEDTAGSEPNGVIDTQEELDALNAQLGTGGFPIVCEL